MRRSTKAGLALFAIGTALVASPALYAQSTQANPPTGQGMMGQGTGQGMMGGDMAGMMKMMGQMGQMMEACSKMMQGSASPGPDSKEPRDTQPGR
jgi:hypothetical protein